MRLKLLSTNEELPHTIFQKPAERAKPIIYFRNITGSCFLRIALFYREILVADFDAGTIVSETTGIFSVRMVFVSVGKAIVFVLMAFASVGKSVASVGKSIVSVGKAIVSVRKVIVSVRMAIV